MNQVAPIALDIHAGFITVAVIDFGIGEVRLQRGALLPGAIGAAIRPICRSLSDEWRDLQQRGRVWCHGRKLAQEW